MHFPSGESFPWVLLFYDMKKPLEMTEHQHPIPSEQLITEKQLSTRVIIIGSGLTGLTLAYYLKKKDIPFVMVEKEQHPGGVIHTHQEQGFTFEAGPNTGVLGNLEIMQLFKDLEGHCQLEVADPQAKKRLIWKKGSWHALPSGFRKAITTPLFTLYDKLRILGEPFRARGKDPLETVSGLVKRRLGNSYLNYAVDPFISGIYAGNPDWLITKFALPKLYQLEQTYGSFIRGAIRKKLEHHGPKPSREVFSVKGGLENLIHALVDQVGPENILTGALHARVGVAPGGYRLTTRQGNTNYKIEAPVVIPTVGAHALAPLFPFFPVQHLEDITNLHYARVVQVVLGFNQWQGGDIKAFGGLVPSREQRGILGVLFTSSFLADRAPRGGALLNVFMGGVRHPGCFEWSDQQIIQQVQQEITIMMRLKDFNPDMVKIYRYRHAIPQYGSDSVQRLGAIDTLQKQYPGLILAGNLQEGIGMADRVAQAMRIANQVQQNQKADSPQAPLHQPA